MKLKTKHTIQSLVGGTLPLPHQNLKLWHPASSTLPRMFKISPRKLHKMALSMIPFGMDTTKAISLQPHWLALHIAGTHTESWSILLVWDSWTVHTGYTKLKSNWHLITKRRGKADVTSRIYHHLSWQRRSKHSQWLPPSGMTDPNACHLGTKKEVINLAVDRGKKAKRGPLLFWT